MYVFLNIFHRGQAAQLEHRAHGKQAELYLSSLKKNPQTINTWTLLFVCN